MVCTSMLMCIYVTTIDVGIVPNGSHTYACMISPPMSARMFVAVQTCSNNIDSNSAKYNLPVLEPHHPTM